MRGMAIQALPDAMMIAGAVTAAIGIYLLAGLAVVLIVAGCGLTFLGWRASR